MKQQDLTQFFLQAQGLQTAWSDQRVMDIASLILTSCKGKLDWDRGAGEIWATILEQEIVALILAKYPLVIVFTSCAHTLQQNLEQEGLIVVEAEDWDTQQYSVDIARVRTIFPGARWASKTVDPQHLSLHDLWWATI